MPYLILDKEFKGYRIYNFSNKITIGRSINNDIIFSEPQDTKISRSHAYIEKENGIYILHDDNSANGTFVNGERIKRYILFNGSRFQIFSYFFTFVEEIPSEDNAINKSASKKSLIDDKTDVFILPEDVSQKRIKLAKRLKEHGIIAENEAMLSLYSDIEEISKISVPVLILGEPGTGKERVAQTIHKFSKAKGDFIALNCSAIPEGVFESELFGSVKGAFHNANDKPGKIELADNGTLFLDEIGDMGISLQPKLLRFLEDKKITRLGDTKVKKINVRIVAATNQDLKSMMKAKSFREDLYQRLACIKLTIPSLRERKEDILSLADFFLMKFSQEHNLKEQKLSDESKKLLLNYNWPGNVRELSNILLGASARNRGSIIYPSHLSAASDDIQKDSAVKKEVTPSLKDIEKIHIKEALENSGGNKVQAAKLLGISRDTLYKKMEKYKIDNKSD